jgi:DNA-directed RNA polymerase II subunit RPB1
MQATIPYSDLSSIGLYVLGDEDNRQDSHVNVTSQDLFRNNLPHPNGIYDAHMGTTDISWPCATCFHKKKWCPGHPGVINLNYPVLSPLFLKDISKWLKVICFNCGKLLILYSRLAVSQKNILGEYVKIMRAKDKNVECTHCQAVHPHLVKDRNDNVTLITEWYNKETKKLEKSIILHPHKIAAIFDKISDQTVIEMGKKPLCHPRKLVLSALRAPPNPIRPDMKKIGGGRSKNNDVTVLLQAVIKINESIPSVIPKAIDDNLSNQINLLNLAVFELIKGSSATSSKRGISTAGNRQLVAISKRLPRKPGRIRRNLMGRRVNYMARSFITCDPFRKLDEVGVPFSIAQNIHIPEVVQEYNRKEMEIYFMNGVDRYPGCKQVKKASTGKTHWIGRINKETFKLELGDIVYRNLVDGDIADFNRQPSLQISNISAMKVVIMRDIFTIAMNVLSCPLFGADFDGDAMNLLFARSKRTTNEIKELSSPTQFFIQQKNGRPMLGEALDSIIGTAKLTRDVVKFDKYHMMKLFEQINIFHDFSQYAKGHMYTGRDAISILLLETGNVINFNGTAFMYQSTQAPYRSYSPTETKVEIDRGILKSGILDTASIGEGKQGGIFHIIHNMYGPDAALDACWDIQQIALAYLYQNGMTVNVGDFLIREESVRDIREIEKGLIADSMHVTKRLNDGKIIPPLGKTIDEHFEDLQINALNPGDEFWKPILTGINHEDNNLYQMIFYKSKGKDVNLSEITAAQGQMVLNGNRMPEKFGRRSLPYSTKYDTDPRSRGYIANSLISGLSCAEYMAAAQNARYSLIQKALSTSITGMQNRMSVKNLESMIIDNQRKVMKGPSIIQMVYGGDGIDARYLERVKMPTVMLNNKDMEVYKRKASSFGAKFSNKGAQTAFDNEYKQLVADRDWFRKVFIRWENNSQKMFSDHATIPVQIPRIIEDIVYNLQLKPNQGSFDPIRAIETVQSLCSNLVYMHLNEIQEKQQSKTKFFLQRSTDLLQIFVRSYLSVYNLVRNGITDTALDLIVARIRTIFSRALVSYGKCVGIIAAQAVSEPMTQMVLDSHHASAASSTRKTGMFRIKEILGARPTEKMLAPSMKIGVLPQFRTNKLKVQEISNHIEMLPLHQFTKRWQIFYETYGEPAHPDFVHEKAMFAEFAKYNKYLMETRPKDLIPWCVRVVLDKSKMILKQMKMETIYAKLREKFPYTFIAYTTDNAQDVVMRIYMRNIVAKKGMSTLQMIDLVKEMLDTIIRGIPGITAAFVKTKNVTEIDSAGGIVSTPTYEIFTDGTNLETVLENPYVDPNNTISDSILEVTRIFGIAAGQMAALNELRYQVDAASYRHYAIYAGEMTYTGSVTSIDRYGSAKRDASIMLRISDASPIAVIEDSATNGYMDTLKGVSPPIMVGKKPQIGDLYNTFCLDEEFVKAHVKNLDDMLTDL